MADEQELQVKVTVNADTAGADRAQASVKGLTGELSNLRRGLGSTRNSTAVFEGIERASKGGIGAIVGLARAFRGFFMIVAEATAASGPIGLLIVAVGGLVGLMIALGHGAKAAGEGLGHGAKKADDFKNSLKELEKESKTDLAAMKKQVDELTKSYDQLLEHIQSAEKRNTELNTASRGLEEATLDAAKEKAMAAAKTPEEREAISKRAELLKQGIGLKYEGNAQNIRLGAAQTEIIDADRQIQRAQDFNLSQQDRSQSAAQNAAELKSIASQGNLRVLKSGSFATEGQRANAHASTLEAMKAEQASKYAAKQADAAEADLDATIRKAEAEKESATLVEETLEIERQTLAKKKEALGSAGELEVREEGERTDKDQDRADKKADAAQKKEDAAATRAENKEEAEQARETRDAMQGIKEQQHIDYRNAQRIFREQAKAAKEHHDTILQHASTTFRVIDGVVRELKSTERQTKNINSFNSTSP